MGDRHEPWGTPERIGRLIDVWSSCLNAKIRFSKNKFTILISDEWIFSLFILRRRPLCRIFSKAFSRAIKTEGVLILEYYNLPLFHLLDLSIYENNI